MAQSMMGNERGTHRPLAALVGMETQAVPADPAPPVLGHALRVGVVPQQPISSPGVADGDGGRGRAGVGSGWGQLILKEEGGEGRSCWTHTHTQSQPQTGEHEDRREDRQTISFGDRQTGERTDRQTGEKTNRQAGEDRQSDGGWTDRQTGERTDMQVRTDSQMEDRQTDSCRADRQVVPGCLLRRMVLVELWYLQGGGGDSVAQWSEPLSADSSSSPWNCGRSHRPCEGAGQSSRPIRCGVKLSSELAQLPVSLPVYPARLRPPPRAAPPE